ncbi:MAG: DNA polymerase III subunit delta, partial [Pseudomonadota bacterium]
MKLPPARWEGFLRKPDPDVVGILFYGTEPGTVQKRGSDLAKALLDGTDDPFALTRLSAEDLSGQTERITEAACQSSLLSGPRVLRLTGMTDSHTTAIIAALDDPARVARLVVEAGNLTPRSKLRAAFEKAPERVAVGCYPLEGRALGDYIGRRLADQGVRADPDALAMITDRLSDNLGQIDQEIDKLVLLAGEERQLDRDLVELALGNTAETTIDSLIQAVGGGDLAGCDQALTKLAAAGESAIGMLRALLRHLGRLHQARCQMDQGLPPDRAISGLAPPVFPRQKAGFINQVNR